MPEAKVLIFTAYSERALLQRGLESGARGYILKEAPHETLLRAIEKVAAGETFVDPALMSALTKSRDGSDVLTAREREILQLLADGMSNADVAAAAVHLPGDGQEPRAAHPHEARGRHAHAGGRDRPARRDDRLTDRRGRQGPRGAAPRRARRTSPARRADPRRARAARGRDRADARRRTRRLRQAATSRAASRSSSARSPWRTRPASTCARSSAGSSRTRSASSGSRRPIAELASATRPGAASSSSSTSRSGDGLGDGAQSGLYQIVRDALDQAVRRGPPTRVTIAIAPSGGGVELRIADDGGEERREAVLDALAERAAELNGDLRERDERRRNVDHDPPAAVGGAALGARRNLRDGRWPASAGRPGSAVRTPGVRLRANLTGPRYSIGSFWTLCSVAYSSTSASMTAAPSGNA